MSEEGRIRPVVQQAAVHTLVGPEIVGEERRLYTAVGVAEAVGLRKWRPRNHLLANRLMHCTWNWAAGSLGNRMRL